MLCVCVLCACAYENLRTCIFHFNSVYAMDLQVRIEMLQCFYSYGRSPTAVLRQFKLQQGLVKDPFGLSSITQLIAKFEQTGSVADKPRCGWRYGVGSRRGNDADISISQSWLDICACHCRRSWARQYHSLHDRALSPLFILLWAVVDAVKARNSHGVASVTNARELWRIQWSWRSNGKMWYHEDLFCLFSTQEWT